MARKRSKSPLTSLRPHEFSVVLNGLLKSHPRSGFPDVASFVLSDTICGSIISVLVMFPLVLGAVGLLGGAIGTIRHRPARIET